MSDIKQKARKAFDEKFPISIDYPPITEMEVFTQIEIDARHKRALLKHQEQQYFIDQIIDLAIAEERNTTLKEIEEEIKKRRSYNNWTHSRGSHSDDPQDTEPCDCMDKKIATKNEVYDNILSLIHQKLIK